MLKLVFYTGARLLKVRHALPHDSFTHSFQWKNKIEFIVTDSSDYVMTWTSMLPDLDPEYAEALVNLVGARYPISSEYEKLRQSCPDILFKNGTDEWIFFGGSFNPWHHGHQACLNLLPEDKICLVIPDRNPFKDLREVNPVTTVLEISTKAKFNKNQYLVPSFLFMDKANPTVYWVSRLKDQFPTHKLSLLMGFDSFASLRKWTRSDELVPLLDTVYVVSRLEDDEDRRTALDNAHAVGPDLNVIFLGKHEYEDLSSSEIRMGQK